MSTSGPGNPEDVVRRFRHQESKARRATLGLSLIPVIVGAAVVVIAYTSVRNLRHQREELRAEVEGLGRDVAALRENREALQGEVSELESILAEKRALFEEVKHRLPARTTESVEALDLLQEGNPAAAVQKYDRVLSRSPNDPRALTWRGVASFQRADLDAARRDLTRAVELAPDHAEAHFHLGLVLWAQGDQKRALMETERAFQLDPGLEARARQNPAYWPMRDAAERMKASTAAKSDEEKRLVDRGVAMAKGPEADLNASIAAYEAALRLNPSNPVALNYRGFALYRLERFDEAADSLRRSIEADPDFGEAHYNLSLVLWAQGRRDEAVEELRRAAETAPRYRDWATKDRQMAPIRRYAESKGLL